MSCPSDLLDCFRWDPHETSLALKVCGKCHGSFPFGDFYNHPSNKDGKHGWCKDCVRASSARSRESQRRQSDAASCSADFTSEFTVTHELVPDALYIMENPRIPGEIKIGRSRDPQERAKQLCAGNNYRMVVKRTWGEKGFLEKTIHKKLKRRRVEEGSSVEWFRISVEQAEALIVAAIIEDDISKS